jgi:hypothetical protein
MSLPIAKPKNIEIAYNSTFIPILYQIDEKIMKIDNI